MPIAPASGPSNWRQRVLGLAVPCGRGAKGMAGGPFAAESVIDSITLDQRDAVGVAVMDARDERAAAVVIVDEMKLPRARRIERRAGEAAHERLQFPRPCFARAAR